MGNYLCCDLPVWCSCRTYINYSGLYDRGVQPAASRPNAIQQSGFLCRSL